MLAHSALIDSLKKHLIDCLHMAQLSPCLNDCLARPFKSDLPSMLILAQASRLMLKRKVHQLPVIQEDGKVVGIVTRHDVLRALIASHSLLLE